MSRIEGRIIPSFSWESPEEFLKEGADDSFFLCKELIHGYLDGITGVYNGPAVATHRFFGTLNRVEAELNRRNNVCRI